MTLSRYIKTEQSAQADIYRNLQNHIYQKVVPARLKYKGGIREVAKEAIRLVMRDCTAEEGKAYFNYLIDEVSKDK